MDEEPAITPEQLATLAREWDLEIGAISEINYRRKPSAALLFDDIIDYPRGYRVLTGTLSNARRMARMM